MFISHYEKRISEIGSILAASLDGSQEATKLIPNAAALTRIKSKMERTMGTCVIK
jgi:hypothetical protein